MDVSCVQSDLLIEANQRLLERRQAHSTLLAKSSVQHPVSQARGDWALQNAQKQLQVYRRRDYVTIQPREKRGETVEFISGVGGHEPAEKAQNERVIRHYPSIGIGAIEQGLTSLYRVWLLSQSLDVAGCGWLDCSVLRNKLTESDSPLKIFSWRRLRQILAKGNGRLWTWDKQNARLWLFGAARLAASLDVSRLTGKPVILPLSALIGGIGIFRAHLYGAFHSGRKLNNPMSRQVQRELLSVPESTQRHYCRVVHIPRQSNIAIGRRYSVVDAQECAYQHGAGTFTFIDSYGRQGHKNGRYIAWQLPTTHGTIHSTALKGRQKKINRTLLGLVNLGVQGNEKLEMIRHYHVNGAEAVKALRKHFEKGMYWLWDNSERGIGIWMAARD